MRVIHRFAVFAPALALALLSACGDDSTTAPTTPPDFAWAGTYAAQTRFGGCSGTWGNGTGGNHDLLVTADREVFRGGTRIIRPTVGEASVSWSRTDGNLTNATFNFAASSTNTCNWGAGGYTGMNFEGTIQYPGEGPLDYRGAIQPAAAKALVEADR
jgi:hypothetical protein